MLKLFKIIPLLFTLLSSSPDKYYRVVNTEYDLFDKESLIVLQDINDSSCYFLITFDDDTLNKRDYNINDTLQIKIVPSSDTIRTKRYFHFSDSKPNYDFFNYILGRWKTMGKYIYCGRGLNYKIVYDKLQ